MYQSEDWKPNLFLVGAAKSGTTSLAELLGTERGVQLPVLKEPFYFVEGYGIKNKDEYRALYRSGGLWRIDASTGYLFDRLCPEKIKEFNPKAKVLIVLRNPIDFMVSYWEYMRANGSETLDFCSAISEEEARRRHSAEFERSCEQWPASYWYTERAFFFDQVARYLNAFEEGEVKVVLFEKIIRDKNAIKDIYSFLGLHLRGDKELPRVNESGKARPFIHFLRFSKYLSPIKQMLYKLLPVSLRLKIRKAVFMGSMTNKGYEKFVLPSEERAKLADIFSEDVEQLRRLLPHLEFDLWVDFSK
ncbi:sulfotransferase domain-containing protein [Aestuariicella hydrocarbonica]|uniref:Sulfotransferase domain-containing protein n=1 Tax=Pseudomaricurvus hydrocarbonicus TaxID=1470433 RepID=A0A9E5T4V5_9GAMM|nr:sulfotransferase domain-containing protein [Aestuariicella hydrocarbonica]NHO68478.1 sulfotransferase domain-containing protein [Aestuariicella hydrocarbonica]